MIDTNKWWADEFARGDPGFRIECGKCRQPVFPTARAIQGHARGYHGAHDLHIEAQFKWLGLVC